ncbi:MAG TPA: flagellar cap protein FliD N-terminal domain-containing protein, partial [Tepidisphaeraceae bacterium]|nr:flagellar cap protein FliD N-terminal domain-containing protein [Tepidisphaeraceae bacterium]
GTITSGVGLISGINTSSIIDQLMALESKPKDLLQTQIDSTNQQKLAYTDLVARLTSLQITGQTLEKPSNFQAAKTTSSDENVLTATASNGAAIGSYSLQVARLTTTQQMVSDGFTDFNSTPIGAGTITIEQGGGEVSSQTTLAQLNGGAGVNRGQFRITDRSGASSVIDTSADVTVDDVLRKINTSLDVSVRATLQGDKIVLNDTSGKAANDLIVQDLGSGTAAADLGIAGNVAGNALTGTDVNYVGRNTLLNQINDNRGIRRAASGNDFDVTVSDGSTISVNLATAKSIGDVIDAINTAGGSKLKADIVPGSNGLRLTDTSGGGGSLSIAQTNGSQAAQDLGLLANPTGSVINGGDIVAGIDTSLISSLRGGSGLSLGQVSFTDRAGHSRTVDFAGASGVQDILDRINNAGGGLQLTASLKDSGNGIEITDTSGGSGNIVIADNGGGQTATQLGIAGTFNAATPAVLGANLQKQWITSNTLLSTLNGGKGISKSQFKITNSLGQVSTIDLSSANVTTVGDVLYRINNPPLNGVTASINANGDGILISDTSAGAGKLTIADLGGTAAADLNIKGAATGTTIDGSYEKTITISANDTLATVQTAINNLNFGVTASVINDGSGTAPYRLSLTAKNSGRSGR